MIHTIKELPERDGAFIMNLAAFRRNVDAIISRIPHEMAGIYAWYRGANYPSNPSAFLEAILTDLRAPKFHERTGNVKPFYEVSIRSKSWLSPSKLEALRRAVLDDVFRDGLIDALNIGPLLQAPLYIGKSADLQKRIRSHLSSTSILRQRLLSAGITMDNCHLLVIPTQQESNCANLENPSDISEEVAEAHQDNHDEYSEMEALYEEIFSRLFMPQFTVRLG